MKITALAGGVGGAKLADGLSGCLSADELTIIVNTGDDFEHWGLAISPDLDTVCYTLAGIADQQKGWGRADDSFLALGSMLQLGRPGWFQLGDKDLATHIERTRRLHHGDTLSRITQDFCLSWNINHRVFPMSDDPVRTVVLTEKYGELPFQEYFVHRHCEPHIKGFRFDGSASASPAPGVLQAIQNADAIVICPSNPWVSIDPILAVAGIAQSLTTKSVFAVSPIITGKAVRGPAAKMFKELGIEPSALAVARHYSSLLYGFILDQKDSYHEKDLDELEIKALFTDIFMKSIADRRRLAQDVLNFIERSIQQK
jgi:LPPG:FO 2-phospho-L-lactate transferase